MQLNCLALLWFHLLSLYFGSAWYILVWLNWLDGVPWLQLNPSPSGLVSLFFFVVSSFVF